MKLYKSLERIGGNKGNEVKPTKTDFLNIQWQEVPNFNINGIDEMTISVVIGLQDTFDLIKVENDNNEEPYDKIRYYYLVGIRNKTAVNKECIFELDLGTTFILEDKNKLFDFPTYSAAIGVGNTNSSAIVRDDKLGTPLVKFTAANIPKKDYIIKPMQWLIKPGSSVIDTYKVGKTGLIPLVLLEGDPYNNGAVYGAGFLKHDNKKDSYISGCIYYVFKLEGGNYFVVPLLSSIEDVFINDTSTPTSTGVHVPYIKGKMTIPDVEINDNDLLGCNNTPIGLKYTVNNYNAVTVRYDYIEYNKNDNKGLKLGELVGVFYGPHNNRISSKMYAATTQNKQAFTQQLNIKVRNDINEVESRALFTADSYFYRGYTIFGYVMGTDGLNVLGFRDYEAYYSADYLEVGKKTLTISGSDQFNILSLAGKLYFTNMLVFSAEGQVIELLTEVPYYIDAYTVKMNNQMNAYNTGYLWNQFNVAKNGILDIAGTLLGSYTPSSTTTSSSVIEGYKDKSFAPVKQSVVRVGAGTRLYKWSNPFSLTEKYGRTRTNTYTTPSHGNMADISNVPITALNTGLQLANNYAMRKAQLDDLRATLSTINTSTNSRCLQIILALSKNYHKDFDDYHIFDLAVGYDAKVIDEGYKLYGYEVNFYKINGSLKNVPDNTFVKTPDTLKIKYLFNNILPPTIRELLWELLTNGVLVVNKELATNGGY